MPWVAADAKRHNKKIKSNGQAAQWAEVANHVLKSTGDEGHAVAAANAAINRRDHRHPGQFKKKKGGGK